MDRPRHCCCVSVAIGRVDGPTTPLLLCVCSNRPRGWTDHVVTRVPLHELASRGPSAPNRTDRRTNTVLSHNIYRARIASRDKNLVYLFVGRLRVNLKVLPSNFFYVFGIPCLATDLCLTPNDIFLGPLEVISIPRNGRPKPCVCVCVIGFRHLLTLIITFKTS